MPRVWDAEESGPFPGYLGARLHLPPNRKHLEARSAPGPPCLVYLLQDYLHTPTQTQNVMEETKPHSLAIAAGRLCLANLVLAGKKERNYLDVYTQTTPQKITKPKQNHTHFSVE